MLVAVVVLGGGALAASAPAAAPTAPLVAVPHADGSQSLQWTLRGSSDQVNVLPHLRCAADPTAAGLFAGARLPCIWLVDHLAPAEAGPLGCPTTGNDYASWRCDMRLYRDLTIEAAYPGQRSLVQFNPKANGGSGVCAWIPIALRVNGGEGQIEAADGCPQRISCAAGSKGQVTADAFDTVSGCPKVVRSTTGGGSGSSSGSGSGSSGVDPATCAGAGAKPMRTSPLYDVRSTARGRRGMNIQVRLRRAVPFTVEIRRVIRGGSVVVRSVTRCGRADVNRITIPDATAGRRAAANYRIVVRSPRSSYPLRSSTERLPRR